MFQRLRFKNLRINEQIFLLTIILITIPSIIISIIIYYFSVQTMKDEYVDSSQLILDNLSFNIDQYLKSIEDGSLAIYYEQDFQNTLEMWSDISEQSDPLISIQSESDLRRFIGSVDISIPHVESVQVLANDKIFHSDFISYQTFHTNLINDLSLYEKAAEAKGKLVLTGAHPSPFSPTAKQVISVTRSINKLGTQNPLAIININIQLDGLHEILSLSETTNRNFAILNEMGSAIYTSDESIVDEEMELVGEYKVLANTLSNQEHSFYESIDNTPLYISSVTSDYSNWTVVQYIEKSEMTSQASQLRFIVYILIILSIITALLFMYMLYKRVTKPVIELSENVNSIRDGNFALKMKDTIRNDEVGALYNGFNKMSQHLLTNIERTSTLKTQQKIAHYSALKSQIQPHFLANALESIQMQAIINGERDVAEMIGLLGELFRKSIQAGKEVVSLRDELTHIRLYIKVQQLRFQDRIQYVEDVDNDSLSMGVLHFSLQPFIENAIIHGIEPEDKKCTITVSTKINEDLLTIQIKDDGLGMNEDQLHDLQKQLSEQTNILQATNIGIKNVHEQIKHYFGEMYGISISSEEGKGTTVTMTLPVHSP